MKKPNPFMKKGATKKEAPMPMKKGNPFAAKGKKSKPTKPC
jgi:hypothetical protein